MELKWTSKFSKDVKRLKKQGKDFDILKKDVLEPLLNHEKLDLKYCDHTLSGNYKGKRECHVKPDWLLIYEITQDYLILYRTGSHAELFK